MQKMSLICHVIAILHSYSEMFPIYKMKDVVLSSSTRKLKTIEIWNLNLFSDQTQLCNFGFDTVRTKL
jgi:hypothetical protein